MSVHIFSDMAPICTVSQAPSRLPELSSAGTQVSRELLPETLPQKAKRKERIAGALKPYQKEHHCICYRYIKNGGHFSFVDL